MNTDSTNQARNNETNDERGRKISNTSAKQKTITRKVKRKVGMREFNKEEIIMINQRNIELIQTLRTLDSAFSMGESGLCYIIKTSYICRYTTKINIRNV